MCHHYFSFIILTPLEDALPSMKAHLRTLCRDSIRKQVNAMIKSLSYKQLQELGKYSLPDACRGMAKWILFQHELYTKGSFRRGVLDTCSCGRKLQCIKLEIFLYLYGNATVWYHNCICQAM